MHQEFVSRPIQHRPVWARMARILRIWLVRFVVPLIVFLLFAAGIYTFFPFFSLHLFLGKLISTWSILSFSACAVILVSISLLWISLLAKGLAISAYRKTVRKSLASTMQSYYHPENAPLLSGNEARHLMVLGLPGSGKTKNLEHFLYEATGAHVFKNKDKIPILIQMKYYDGFLRQYQHNTPDELHFSSSGETILAYLLSEKHSRGNHSKKETELIGMHHLRPYLWQFMRQGRLVLLCDGINELGHNAQLTVRNELIALMETDNRVIMTCRELEYQEQGWIRDLTEQGAIPKTLPALSENDVPLFVRRYLEGQRSGKGRHVTPSFEQIEQITEQICRINRPHRYSSPFMLIMLIQALQTLDTFDESQAQTISRGKLLQISVNQRLERTIREEQKVSKEEVLRFFSVVACTARLNQQRNALQIASTRRSISRARLAEDLNDWLNDNGADVSTYTLENIQQFLTIAQDAGLITVSSYGVLSFMHELIAEYCAAEYLCFTYHKQHHSEDFWQSLYESEEKASGIWSEPVALWAGLEERSQDVATFLVEWVSSYGEAHNLPWNDRSYFHALALSLACVGVNSLTVLPHKTRSYLTKFVQAPADRTTLAKIFKRCADEGGSEVYEALLPLLQISGLSDLFLELHELSSSGLSSNIPTILFEHLEKVASSTSEAIEPKLISLLGELGRRHSGELVSNRTRHVLDDPSKPVPLQIAALGILGLLKNAADVPRFIAYLYDEESTQLMAGAAISALVSCGPELTLAALAEKEQRDRHVSRAQVRLNLVLVLEGFLNVEQTSPQMVISAPYDVQLLGLLIQFLSQFDGAQTREIVLNLLHQQMQHDERTPIVIDLLLNMITTSDPELARSLQKLLQENCTIAFPRISAYWDTSRAGELAHARIVEVLGNAHIGSVRSFLLQKIDNPIESIQNALGHALSLHQPESIHPLLTILLSPTASASAMKVAKLALEEIGAASIHPISHELSRIATHIDAPEHGLLQLVNLLASFNARDLIDDHTETGVVSSLNKLFIWLVKSTRYTQLIERVVQVMVGFRNPQVISPLLGLLGRSENVLHEACNRAVEGLSSLGELAFKPLIDVLDGPQDSLMVRRARLALVGMQPFPLDKLLASLRDRRLSVVQQVRQIFAANEKVMYLAAPFLVNHLLDDPEISHQIQQAIKEIEPKVSVPYLIAALDRSSDWQIVLERLLTTCREQELVIQLLSEKLGDAQRCEEVSKILLRFPPLEVLPWLTASLENTTARQSAKLLILQMVDLSPKIRAELLKHIVALFDPVTARPARLNITPEGRIALQELLTNELANKSLTALVDGLQEKALMKDCAISLVTLAHIKEREDEIVEAILQALRLPSKRNGAHHTLVKCGVLVAERVCNLLADRDSMIVEEACLILADMGQITFPFIHKLAHDPRHLADAKKILRLMSRPIAAKGLLSFFASNTMQETEIAFNLLWLGIENDDITRSLLIEIQEQQNSDLVHRVLIALLFFYNGTQNQQRRKIAELLISMQKNGTPYRTEFMRALLLLGEQAREPLVRAIAQTKKPDQTLFEAIGIAGQFGTTPEVVHYVENFTANTGEQEAGLYALGGLLASGSYGLKKLEQLRTSSKHNGDLKSFEFYDILLGERHMPELAALRTHIEKQKNTIEAQETQLQKQKKRTQEVEIELDTALRRADAALRRAEDAEMRYRMAKKV